MPNNRIFYAIQALGFAEHNVLCPTGGSAVAHVGSGTHPSGFIVAQGVQSVGLNTTFNLE